MGGLLNIIVADDPELARERLLPYATYQRSTYQVDKPPEGAVALIQQSCAGLPSNMCTSG